MFPRLALALLLASASFIPAKAQNAAAPVATVNGRAITEAELKTAEAEMGDALANIPAEQRRDQLIDYLVSVRLLSDAARKEKLDAAPDYAQRRAFNEDKMLMEMLMRDKVAKAVTPEAIKAFYQERLKSVKPEEEVRARHILLENEDQAKKAIADINGGKKFEEAAKELSKDPGSAKEGGDLGYFTKDRMVPEFSKAAFEAPVGKLIPTPVKSQFGWHVIKVEDRRKQMPPDLAAVEPQIRMFLTRKAQGDLVTELRKTAKIEKPEAKKAEETGKTQ